MRTRYSFTLLASFLMLQMGFATPQIAIEGGTEAFKLSTHERVLVSQREKGFSLVDLKTQKILPIKREGSVMTVAESEQGLLVVVANEKGARIELLAPNNLLTLKSVQTDIPFDVTGILIPIRKDIVALWDGQGRNLHMVDLSSKKTVKVDQPIKGMLYMRAVVSVRGNLLYLPGAYPGNISVLDTSDFENTRVVGSFMVSDWIHNVHMLGDERALIAGHLEGVALATLQEGSAKSEVLLRNPRAQLLVMGDVAYAAGAGKVSRIDLKTKEIETKEVSSEAPASFGVVEVPLGVYDGKLVVFRSGAGLYFVEF